MRLVLLAALAALAGCAAEAPGRVTDVAANDAPHGRLLYETHCGGCHYEKLHTRKSTRIDTLAALKSEVTRWNLQTSRRFTPAEVDDVADYLNRSHYRLGK